MKKENLIKAVVFVALVISLYYYTYYVEGNTNSNDTRFIPCIQLLQNNALYTGQPICGMGPVGIYIGYFISLFTGHLLEARLLLMVIFTIAMIFLINNIAEIKNKYIKILIGASVILVFYDVAVDSFDIVAASFFMLLSFYIEKNMKDDKFNVKYILIGLTQALSVLSKTTLAIVYVAYYLYPSVMFAINKNIQTGEIKRHFYSGLSAVALIFVTYLKYPLVFDYSLFIHEGMKNLGFSKTYFDTVALIFSSFGFLGHQSVFIIISIILVLVFFLMKKDKFSFIYLFLTVALLSLNKETTFSLELLFSKYLIFFFLIFLLSIGRYLENDKNSKFLILGLILFILFSPRASLENTQASNIIGGKFDINLVNDFYKSLPVLENTAVENTTYQLLSDQYKKSIKSDMILEDFQESGLYAQDGNQFSGMKRLNIFNPNATNPYYDENVRKLGELKTKVDKIIYSRPNLIFLDPYFDGGFISDEIYKNNATLADYCVLRIPYLPTNKNRGGSFLFYKNVSICAAVLRNANDYFRTKFDQICRMDSWVAEFVVAGTLKDQFNFNLSCNSGKSNYPNTELIGIWYILSMIFSLAWLYYLIEELYLKKRIKAETRQSLQEDSRQ